MRLSAQKKQKPHTTTTRTQIQGVLCTQPTVRPLILLSRYAVAPRSLAAFPASSPPVSMSCCKTNQIGGQPNSLFFSLTTTIRSRLHTHTRTHTHAHTHTHTHANNAPMPLLPLCSSCAFAVSSLSVAVCCCECRLLVLQQKQAENKKEKKQPTTAVAENAPLLSLIFAKMTRYELSWNRTKRTRVNFIGAIAKKENTQLFPKKEGKERAAAGKKKKKKNEQATSNERATFNIPTT